MIDEKLPEIIWREIPGIPTHEVSNTGEVRSKDRISTVNSEHRFYRRRLKGHLLQRVFTKRDGEKSYVSVSINDRNHVVHRLVARTFLADSYFLGAQVNHKDGDKQNNYAENLEWVTPSENEFHSYRVLGKRTWNTEIPFSNPKGLKMRKRNYLIRCFELLFWKEISHLSDAKLARFCGMSSRQLNQNLQVARKERMSHV